MRVLVFGTSGQVATELRNMKFEDILMEALGRDVADLSVAGTCAHAIRKRSPDAVINAAAYTAVDQAESEEHLATLVNANAPTEMASACANLDIPLVHISTDYVFDGTGLTKRLPTDPTSPVNAYGRSKLAGEVGVKMANGRHAILRTSWVFSTHGKNFFNTMMALSDTRDALNVVSDQVGGPTAAADIAAACVSIARQLAEDPSKSGTFHFSGAPDVSWADFARAIFDMAGRSVTVTDIPSSAYPTPAARPLNSRLDCRSLEKTFGLSRPDWRKSLDKILDQLGAIQ